MGKLKNRLHSFLNNNGKTKNKLSNSDSLQGSIDQKELNPKETIPFEEDELKEF